MNDRSQQQQRRQHILDRARSRQSLIRQRDVDEAIAPEINTEPSKMNINRQKSPAIPTPVTEIPTLPAEFEHHHNAVRLYIIEQFEIGKNSREIGDMIGLTPWRITRWYNQVRHLPAAARLWTPLLTPAEIRRLRRETTEIDLVDDGDGETVVPRRERRPTKAQTREVRRQSKITAKTRQLADDRRLAQARMDAAMSRCDSDDVALRIAAAEFYTKDKWNLSRIARAVEMDVSTVSRWMSRVREFPDLAPENILGSGMDKRGSLVDGVPSGRRPGRPRKGDGVSAPRVVRRAVTPAFQLISTDTSLGRRAVALIKEIAGREDGWTDKGSEQLLAVRSVVERERLTASLSLLGFSVGKAQPRGTGFLVSVSGADQVRALKQLISS
jgi:hypothetical protein